MSVQIVANVLAPSEFNPLPSFAPPSKRKFCHQSYELCVKVPTLHAVTQFAKFLSRHPTNGEQNRESPTDLKWYFVCGWNSSWAWSCLATWWKTNWQAKTESELSIFKTHRLLSDQQRWHAVKHLTLSANSEQQPTGYSGGENEGDSKGILCKGKQEPKIEGTSGHCPHTFAENRKERQLAAEIAGEIEAVIEA